MTDRKPRPRLRRARLERGWGLAKAAEMFTGIAWHEGYLPRDKQATPGMFSKWESGEKAPRGWRVEVLVTLYGKPASELDLLDDSETIRYDTSHALAEQGTLDGMKRRAAIVSIASAALGVTADRVIPLVRTRESGIVTPESVQLVRDGVAHVHRMDDQLGASVAVDFAAKYLHIAGEQLTARPENSLRRHLLQLKGELEQFMGWSAFDAEADALARSWYERALVDANRADDMGLSAYILGHLAIVTTYAGQPAQALVFAEAAANRARQQVPAVRSWVGTAHAETRCTTPAFPRMLGTGRCMTPGWAGRLRRRVRSTRRPASAPMRTGSRRRPGPPGRCGGSVISLGSCRSTILVPRSSAACSARVESPRSKQVQRIGASQDLRFYVVGWSW